MRASASAMILLAFLVACTDFPELDAVVSDEAKKADYPNLVAAERLLVKRKEGRITAQTGADLLARADRLRARAALIRGIETVDEATRLRLRAKLRSLGG